MRTIATLGSILTAAGLLTAGCAGPVSHVAGDAAPVTAAPVVVTSLPSAAPSVPAPSVPAPSVPAPSVPAPSGVVPAILGPYGLGALKLGMTRAQASATGMITSWADDPDHRCYIAHLTSGARNTVYFDPRIGVSAIVGSLDMRTPEGIHVRSTTADALRAYPDWKAAGEEPGTLDGRGYADVPGNSKATYRIAIQNGLVVSVALQDDHQGCYE
jgi:hypothetical protein